jgi:imidazolonepropionase-like amidohydrolase
MGSIALVRQTLLDAGWYEKARAAGTADLDTALEELAAYDAPFIIETRDELTLLRASRIAAELGRQMVYLGTHREGNRMDEIAALKSPIILPLSLPRRPDVIRPGDELEVTLGQLRLWERAQETAGLLESRGVPLAFTTWKSGPEEDFFGSIREMIRAGLSPKAALAALTTTPAMIAGVDRELGTLEKGKRASFVIATGDLFATDAGEAADVLGVWIDGEESYRADPDFRGTYETRLGDRAVQLQIRGGSKSKVTASVHADDAATDKADVQLAGRAGMFSVDLTPIGIEGNGWFRLDASESTVALTYRSPDGRRSWPEMNRVASTRSSEEAEETEAAVEEAPISRRTLPNIAFGWEQLPRQETVLIRNATIWTSDADGVIEGADMLVAGGRVRTIGRNLKAPEGARVIDATGRHVTPGIIDEHSHLAISGGVNEGTHAATAEVRIGDVVNPDDVGIYRALSGGVTVAQLLHGSANPIGGQAQIIRFKWGLGSEALKFDEAPPSIKFALGENVKQSNWGDEYTIRYPQTRMGVESFIRDRFLAAREYATAWKTWNALPKEKRAKTPAPRRDLQLETLVEILESRRFIHCHSYVQSEILMLMRLAEELGFRISTFTHILEGYKVASEMKTHGAGAAGFSDWWAYKAEVFDAIPYSPCITYDKGVVTAINSDSANTIRRLNQEAGKMVMYCGLDQAEALKMVTINPARLLGIEERVGSLKEGKDADFVIWSGNPLSMSSRVEQTWIEGTNYFDVERDAAMRERDEAEKSALLGKAATRNDKRGGAPPEASEAETWHCDDLGGLTNAR